MRAESPGGYGCCSRHWRVPLDGIFSLEQTESSRRLLDQTDGGSLFVSRFPKDSPPRDEDPPSDSETAVYDSLFIRISINRVRSSYRCRSDRNSCGIRLIYIYKLFVRTYNQHSSRRASTSINYFSITRPRVILLMDNLCARVYVLFSRSTLLVADDR